MESDLKQSIDKLIKENKSLKRSNLFPGVYVVVSLIVMLYNYYGHLLH